MRGNAGAYDEIRWEFQNECRSLGSGAHDDGTDVADGHGGLIHFHAGERGEMHKVITDEGDFTADLLTVFETEFYLLAGAGLQDGGLIGILDRMERSVSEGNGVHGGDEGEDVQCFHDGLVSLKNSAILNQNAETGNPTNGVGLSSDTPFLNSRSSTSHRITAPRGQLNTAPPKSISDQTSLPTFGCSFAGFEIRHLHPAHSHFPFKRDEVYLRFFSGKDGVLGFRLRSGAFDG